MAANADTADRLLCWSCAHYRRAGCELGRQGFPRIGTQCAAFDYEPGTSPQEFDSYADYARTALQEVQQ